MTFHDTLGKDAWRRRVLRARKQQTVEDRDCASRRIADHLGKAARPGQTVAAYVPMDSEPGSVTMLDALVDAGIQVLLPVTVVDSPLTWALYTGPADLSPAAFGLREPTGPDLGPGGLARANAIFVPALAVDSRGVRLGRGAGYYDRSLAMVDGEVPLIAVVNDGELVDALPDEPHDIRMTHALTPSGGLQALEPAGFVGSRT